jgi:putative peptidoglycan lipid II flippase
LYVLLNQVGLAIVLRAAGSAAAVDVGRDFGASVYNNAFILFTLPHGLVAVSVITALLPRMSRAAVDERFTDIADDLSLGTRLSSTLLIPATTLMVALGPPIGVLIYGHGNAAAQGTTIGEVAAFAALGLVPFAISQLQTFVFYAMREAKTAAFVNIPVVVMRVVGSLLVAELVPANFVLQALMIVNTGSYLLAAAVGAILLRQRLGRLHLGRTLSTLVRVTLAAVPAAAAALAVQIWLSQRVGQNIAVVVALAIGGLLYVGLALLVRVREIHEVLQQIRRRVSR